MSDGDVVLRGRAPGVSRRRRPVWLAIGAVLSIAGLVLLAGAVALMVDADGLSADRRLASGAVGSTLAFTSDGDPVTVVVLTSTTANATLIDRQVAATECTTGTGPDLRVVRGARQSSSLRTDELSTVGWFEPAPGPTTVTCRSTRAELGSFDLAVVPGRPPGGGLAVAALFGGILTLLAGLGATARGWAGRTHITR